MALSCGAPKWEAGPAPVSVVMLSLNEGHNMAAVLENLKGWAGEVFLVDSYSRDDTVEIALSQGVQVVQRRFRGFGDQWNFAASSLPFSRPWTIKLDPDERISDRLKEEIVAACSSQDIDAYRLNIRLFFMSRPLPVRLNLLRLWRTGTVYFSDVLANEHAQAKGAVGHLIADIEHHDSPNLHHWIDKQNRYTTAEALARYRGDPFAAAPLFWGTPLERRMWLKKHFMLLPLRYQLMYVLQLISVKPWLTGYEGMAWVRQRVWVRRMIEDKLREMRTTGRESEMPLPMLGQPHPEAHQCD